MHLFDATAPVFDKSLRQIEHWIDKAHDFAKAKNVEPGTMLQARLAIDQFPLVRQIQSACDGAKLLMFRLAAKDAPKHADTETSWEELRARITNVRELVRGFEAKDIDEARILELPFFQGKKIRALDYALSFALPNFNFHFVTTYAIFRHIGVDLGKKDFIGALPFLDA